MAKKKKKQTVKSAVPWREYLDSIRYRYPYVLPPAIIKVHPFVVISGQRVAISKGAYHGPSGRVLKRRNSRGRGK